MILLNSNAEDLFWLGRYITRVQYLCGKFPFMHDKEAMLYAKTFGLPAFDATSLNELILDNSIFSSFERQFECIKNNIHELRAVLSANGFAKLNKIIQVASQDPSAICDVVGECYEVLDSESHEVFIFIKLGQGIEQFDRQIRLNEDLSEMKNELNIVVNLLEKLGWTSLMETWSLVAETPNETNFYAFTDKVQSIFEENV